MPDYDYILLNGGDDGPVAGEMNRMVESIQEKLDHLKTMEDDVRKLRNPQRKFYSIIIDPVYLNGPGKKNAALKKFIRKYKAYANQDNPNIWTTSDLEQRNGWWELLNNINEARNYSNSGECPLCGKIETENSLRRAVDDYQYCEDCYVEYDLGRL
ncbi:hypothetical protein SPSYN_02949 [Sporotomaculum syntrophicum]|uniref:Uncharacterized protein n=1 Tax=Sporotomaculum syntrophicum TaxID=182264 RepID=A0A9D2WP38_9FIRM|nr:hypothetical protein [Sporotomaculum syntrophicum]KAF1084037.1 hypothetical protein SPSYN_02949 [Sporotomaculum syntrophicum]